MNYYFSFIKIRKEMSRQRRLHLFQSGNGVFYPFYQHYFFKKVLSSTLFEIFKPMPCVLRVFTGIPTHIISYLMQYLYILVTDAKS